MTPEGSLIKAEFDARHRTSYSAVVNKEVTLQTGQVSWIKRPEAVVFGFVFLFFFFSGPRMDSLLLQDLGGFSTSNIRAETSLRVVL